MISSILCDKAGFYSELFFTMNHYIFCKLNNINFKLDSSRWLFKYKEGWTDYFENIDINDNDNDNNNKNIKIQYDNSDFKHLDIIHEYPLLEYKNIIPIIYKYNDTTLNKVHETMKEFNLMNKSFDSIFIRRGDKLFEESFFINAEKYVDLLLEKNPLCTDLFVQTDDYNCFIEIKQYIESNNLNIQLYTLCSSNERGTIVTEHADNIFKKGILHDNKEYADNIFKQGILHNNKEYLNKIKNNLLETKPIYLMTPTEKYNHTINMIIGVDIVLHSNICITDFQSNVSRFIKLAHLNNSNVFSVLNPKHEINYNYCLCPAYNFSYSNIG